MSGAASATREIDLDDGWRRALRSVLDLPWRDDLRQLLADEAAAGCVVYPPRPLIFNAFRHTPLGSVRVVVLGQDPYHGPGQAVGLSFSVPRGVQLPPSLRNILRELRDDTEVAQPDHGDLTAWADHGVLLLNTSLTVRAGAAGSHAGRGWERFTDAVISAVSTERPHVAFVLWGRHARAKRALIDQTRHLIIESAHPSPLSAHNGFFGSRPFSRINEWFASIGEPPVDWLRPD